MRNQAARLSVLLMEFLMFVKTAWAEEIFSPYQKDSIGSHSPTKDTDWLDLNGYNTLKSPGR